MPLSLQAILGFSATLVRGNAQGQYSEMLKTVHKFAFLQISMAFVGHIGKHELSAAVLGTSLFNVTGFSILIGLCSAMETLCGQVWHKGCYLVAESLAAKLSLVTLGCCCRVLEQSNIPILESTCSELCLCQLQLQC